MKGVHEIRDVRFYWKNVDVGVSRRRQTSLASDPQMSRKERNWARGIRAFDADADIFVEGGKQHKGWRYS